MINEGNTNPSQGVVQYSEEQLKTVLQDRRNEIRALRKETKTQANFSLAFGILAFLVAVGMLTWVAIATRYNEPKPIYQCAADKNGMLQQCCSGYESYDMSIYAFFGVAALLLLISTILIRSYAGASRQDTSFQRELITMRDIEIAFEISKSLPSELIKEEMIQEKKDDDKGDKNFKSDKLFPRVKAQQQIIETLLSKYSI